MQSFDVLEELAPTLEFSIFLMTVEVNLESSLMGVKLTDLWSDLGVDLFLSSNSVAGFFLNGVRISSFLEQLETMGLAGEDGTLGALWYANDDFEEVKSLVFFLFMGVEASWFEL